MSIRERFKASIEDTSDGIHDSQLWWSDEYGKPGEALIDSLEQIAWECTLGEMRLGLERLANDPKIPAAVTDWADQVYRRFELATVKELGILTAALGGNFQPIDRHLIDLASQSFKTNSPHFRRCHDCGHINRYADAIVPECLCRKCKSQDTRRMKNTPPLWGDPAKMKGVHVPKQVAECPECGGELIAESHANEVETGRPSAPEIQLWCMHEDAKPHAWRQSDWQPVRDRIVKWVDAHA